MTNKIQDVIPKGEGLRHRKQTRDGGTVGLTDKSLLLLREDERIRISYSDVEEIQFETFDWFLGVLSVVMIGFGILSIDRNIIGALIFTAAGAGSLYLTYKKRGRVSIKVRNRPKPLKFYVDDTEDLRRLLSDLLDEYEEKLQE